MRTTVDHFTTAREAALATARGLARTIADTLTAMYPGAAYLVLRWDQDDDVLWLQSIRNTTGVILCDFDTPAELPELTDTDLRQAWGDLDPRQPVNLLALIRLMEDTGGRLDFLPETAEHEDDPHEGPSLVCILLSEKAEPGLWDWGGTAVLRPYSAPEPPALRTEGTPPPCSVTSTAPITTSPVKPAATPGT
ncbi:hypothetical protein [Streptomyces sp. NPDC050485]|uniref:hypothetical protein n=1 Tax=Streptomyces sp. NPDC050485 TaxID=3365617 RepID=UPI0037924BCB